MPNWCDNTLYMTHKDPKMMDKAIQGWKDGKFFGTLYPEPDYTKVVVMPTFPHIKGNEPVNPDQAWYDWRLQNWGTKWEIVTDESYIDIQENEHGKSIRASFSTAWSPPTDLYNKLVKDGYEIKAMYYEGGCAFCGLYEDGTEEFYDIDGNWKWAKENIPQDIDCEFDISRSMMEWRGEELADEIEGIEEELKETDTQELRDQLAEYKAELEEIENA